MGGENKGICLKKNPGTEKTKLLKETPNSSSNLPARERNFPINSNVPTQNNLASVVKLNLFPFQARERKLKE